MSEIIPVQQFVYDKDRFSKVIDTQFRELAPTETVTPEITVDEFFILYDELFFEIPREGDINSHRYILQREADYLGVQFADDVDIQALLQEITDLRQQLLAAETTNARLEELVPISDVSTAEREALLAESTVLGIDLLQNETLVNEQALIESTLAASQDIIVADQTELAQELTPTTTVTNANLVNNSPSTQRRYNPLLRRYI
jgi:hypothetical protein